MLNIQPNPKGAAYKAAASAAKKSATGVSNSFSGSHAGAAPAVYQPGYIDKRGQFAGNLNGHRKISTILALANSGNTGSLNAKEWELLKAQQAGGAGAAGGTTVGDEAYYPGSASMADLVAQGSEDAFALAQRGAAERAYTAGADASQNQYNADNAVYLGQYGDSRQSAGINYIGQGGSSNPAIAGFTYVADRTGLDTQQARNEAANKQRIAAYAKAREEALAQIQYESMRRRQQYLATTRTDW